MNEDERMEAQIRADMRKRIEVGMAKMDEIEPEWERYIDPQVLDLALGDACIVGQVRQGRPVYDDVFMDDPDLGVGDSVYPSQYGMDVTDWEFEHSGFSTLRLYGMLTEEWLFALRMRAAERQDVSLEIAAAARLLEIARGDA